MSKHHHLSSWGNYPQTKNEVFPFKQLADAQALLESKKPFISYGNGRSYGDSALSDQILLCKPHHYFLDFDPEQGILEVQSGVLLSEILEIFVPKGWFLKVAPGTKLITVGGAIASDIHGKNHHVQGCFSESVVEFSLLQKDGSTVICSKEQNKEIFLATCGGMGLTGVILSAKLQLKPIQSQYINQVTIKTKNLEETFQAFEEYKGQPYSVAWIDCLAKGNKIGKSLLMVGDFAEDGDLNFKESKSKNVPFFLPSFCLNKWSVRLFNWLYYAKVRKRISEQKVGLNQFFFPLDAIHNWNRIYGKGGFTQYQFILPRETSYQGLQEILTKIAASGKGSFLAVLKLYGKENENYLSFPIEGYSLALDFKIEKGLFELLDELDKIVVQYHGRIYLTKDVRVSKEVFEQGYPQVDRFREFREKHGLKDTFQSLQSNRLEI